jgi:hypothetical protein
MISVILSKIPYTTEQGIILAEQGILAQKQGISPAKTKSMPDGVFGTHRRATIM